MCTLDQHSSWSGAPDQGYRPISALLADRRERRLTERNRSHCANPATHLGVVLLSHVKKMGHRGMQRWTRPVVWRHIHDAAEHFQETAIPVFGNVMQRGEAGVDEGLQIGADRFATLPIRNAEIADSILREAVEAVPEGLVVNLLPHVEEPPGRFFLCKHDLHISLLDFAIACSVPRARRSL